MLLMFCHHFDAVCTDGNTWTTPRSPIFFLSQKTSQSLHQTWDVKPRVAHVPSQVTVMPIHSSAGLPDNLCKSAAACLQLSRASVIAAAVIVVHMSCQWQGMVGTEGHRTFPANIMAYTEERFNTNASTEYGSLSFVQLLHAWQTRERSVTSPRLVSNFSATRSDFMPHLAQLAWFAVGVDRVDTLSKHFPSSATPWTTFIRFGGVGYKLLLRWRL